MSGSSQVPLSWALGWVDTALAHEEENRELRRILSVLFVGYVQSRELLVYAREEIEARFPEERAA